MKQRIRRIAVKNHIETLLCGELIDRNQKFIQSSLKSPVGHAIGVVNHENVIHSRYFTTKERWLCGWFGFSGSRSRRTCRRFDCSTTNRLRIARDDSARTVSVGAGDSADSASVGSVISSGVGSMTTSAPDP